MRITPVAAAAPPAVPDSAASVPVAVREVPVRLLNPQPVIDPALGIVVTEYYSRAGQMTEQFPTARALDTYRIYGLHGSADEPEFGTGTGTGTGSGTGTGTDIGTSGR